MLNKLLTSQGLPARLIRFGFVGGLSSIFFVIVVGICVEAFGMGKISAVLVAYGVSVPVNYLVHRKVTFRSEAPVRTEIFRFLVLHSVNLAVAVAGMTGVADGLGLSYWIGSLAVAVLVPISSFLVMNFWVFVSGEAKS